LGAYIFGFIFELIIFGIFLFEEGFSEESSVFELKGFISFELI
jgi:hypothetical protein